MYKRINKDILYLGIAKLFSLRSTCLRKHVGCVIVKNGRIISTGFNGALPGMDHCTPDTCNDKKPCLNCVHAEANAIAYAAKSGISLEGSSIYTTLFPCTKCAELLVQSGIKEVNSGEDYRDDSAIKIFQNSNIRMISFEFEYQNINFTFRD